MNEPKSEAMKPYEDYGPFGPLLPSELHQAAMMQQNLISAYDPLGLRSEIAHLKEQVKELEKQNDGLDRGILAQGQLVDELQVDRKRQEAECAAMRNFIHRFFVRGVWRNESGISYWDEAKTLLGGTAGRSLLERLEKMEKALRAHHDHHLQECKVFFEQDGRPIDIVTDLGEAYSESQLYYQTEEALSSSALAGDKKGDA